MGTRRAETPGAREIGEQTRASLEGEGDSADALVLCELQVLGVAAERERRMRKVMLDERERVERALDEDHLPLLAQEGGVEDAILANHDRGPLGARAQFVSDDVDDRPRLIEDRNRQAALQHDAPVLDGAATLQLCAQLLVARQMLGDLVGTVAEPEALEYERLSDTGSCERGTWAGIRGQRFRAEAGQLFECVGFIHMRLPYTGRISTLYRSAWQPLRYNFSHDCAYAAAMASLGTHLKGLRKQSGLSYRRLADAVGISHNNLASYEADRVMPSFQNAVKLCQFFNVPLEYLLVGQKADFRYHDLRLAELFLQADALPAEYRTIIKAYLRSVMTHAAQKERLIASAAAPELP